MDSDDYEKAKAIEEITIVLPLLRTIVESVTAIQRCETAEEAEAFIGLIEYAESNMPGDFNMTEIKGSVRDRIRNGFGDFEKIKDKCIRLGVV